MSEKIVKNYNIKNSLLMLQTHQIYSALSKKVYLNMNITAYDLSLNSSGFWVNQNKLKGLISISNYLNKQRYWSFTSNEYFYIKIKQYDCELEL